MHEYRGPRREQRAASRSHEHEGRASEELALGAWHEYRIVPHEYRIIAHEYRIAAHDHRVAAPASFAGQAQAFMDLGSGSVRTGDDWQPIFESTEDRRVTIEVFPVRGVTVDVLAAREARGEASQQLTVRNTMTVTVVGALIGARCRGGPRGAGCCYRVLQIGKP